MCNSDHWYERNRERFEQLIICLLNGQVVPFIGAGVSVSSGFPTWKGHLQQQGRTAGILAKDIDDLLHNGEYEAVIEKIEKARGKDVFYQEIRDVFSRTPKLDYTILHITELFTNTIITTNYDRALELGFDNGNLKTQIISGVNAFDKREIKKVTILKLHGSIEKPATCILGKNNAIRPMARLT